MRVTVDIGEQEFKRLQEIAVDERRSLREQAAWELVRALKERPKPISTKAAAEGGRDGD